MVFGLTKTPEEDVSHRICGVLDSVGEKPQFVAERIGTVREGVARPVLVKLRKEAVAAGIRRKAGRLKKTDSFKTVIICGVHSQAPGQNPPTVSLVVPVRLMAPVSL